MLITQPPFQRGHERPFEAVRHLGGEKTGQPDHLGQQQGEHGGGGQQQHERAHKVGIFTIFSMENLFFKPRYPCPICKKAFSKVGNVYKHLANQHNKSKTEYLKMSKTIRNNAFIDEKENEDVEEMPPKLQFVKARPPDEAMQVIRIA